MDCSSSCEDVGGVFIFGCGYSLEVDEFGGVGLHNVGGFSV